MISTMRGFHKRAIVLASLQSLVVVAFPQSYPENIFSRQAPTPDVQDLGFVRKWAAIGDSYSAGIGAGKKIADSGSCARYDNSYPVLINSYELMPDDPVPAFEYLACSGATTPEVLANQSSKLTDSYDLITVSTGGNDVGLKDILNACIYQWFSRGDAACDNQLDETARLINDTLPGNLDNLMTALKPKINNLRKIYFTGYAKFFAETSTECDGVTWAFWFQFGTRQFLTQARRKRMNDLTLAVNKAISDAVARAGDSFAFVDYDQHFTDLQGLFCQDGVKEPDGNRDGLLFFEWNTNSETTNLKRSEISDDDLPTISEDEFLAILEARQTNNGSTDGSTTPSLSFEDSILNLVTQALADNSSLQLSLPDNSGPDPGCRGRCLGFLENLIPDTIGRVFHPRPGGHAIIANLVIWNIALTQSKTPGGGGAWGPEIVEPLSSCPLPGNSTKQCAPPNGCSCQDADRNFVDSATSSCCSTAGGKAAANGTSGPMVCQAVPGFDCTVRDTFGACCTGQAAGNVLCS
ncbi:SGNH hydrolase-type esterase domain-containing protein [Bisporella sp. PMI_857]|nr:SGNH hydrolase-type esterase domain-containing protein [Bisporella sp. PMI_857]